MIGVYKIAVNDKCYVGSSSFDIANRWNQHLSKLRKGTHGNAHLQNSFNKHGEEVLIFSVLEVVETPEGVIDVEQKYIDELKPEYNLCPVAGSSLGIKRTAEFKQKCVDRLTGISRSEETKRKIGIANKISQLGAKHTDATKLKMSVLRTGHLVSAETREKISKGHIGIKKSEETRKRMSEGHNNSDETRKKKSEANIGHIVPEDVRSKISKGLMGHKVSEETRQKISETHKRNREIKNSA